MKNNHVNSLNNKIIAVTGGCGFIGSHIVERLQKEGVKKIIVIDSLEYGKISNLIKSEKIELIKFNLGFDKQEILIKCLKNVDYLFHLAAEKHNQSKDKPQKVQQSNIIGMYDLIEAATINKVKKIIFSSSLYAYGRMNKPKYEEKEIPLPQTIYGMTKLAGENILRFFEKNHNIKYIILRFLFVYGPKQYAGLGYKSVIVSNFNKIINGESPTIYGNGEQTLDYIYVDDVVDVMIEFIKNDISGETFNVGSSKPIDINKLTDIMLNIANSKLTKKYLPRDYTFGSYRVANTNKLKKAINFKPKIDIKDGLKKTYNWLLNSKNNIE